MNHLVIGIPTYKRPVMLRNCLNSILESELDGGLISTIDILIVDNDVELSAKEVFFDFESTINEPFFMHYGSLRDKGLSNVRNEILKRAKKLDPDFIVFIDDDEYASKTWLQGLTNLIVGKEADIVVGKVIPVFEVLINKGLKYWFKYPDLEDGSKIDFVMTGNLIISPKFIIENSLSFDLRFNTTGGEDSFFGVQSLNKGAKIFFAQYALVYETIPENKSNLKWLIMRYYRGATTFTYVLKLERRYFLLFKKFLTSIIYLIFGIFALLLLLMPIKLKYWGVIKISEAIGAFAGMMNMTYHEFRN